MNDEGPHHDLWSGPFVVGDDGVSRRRAFEVLEDADVVASGCSSDSQGDERQSDDLDVARPRVLRAPVLDVAEDRLDC